MVTCGSPPDWEGSATGSSDFQKAHNRTAHNGAGVSVTAGIGRNAGWSPDISQPKPLKPGSGQVNLNNFLNAKK